MPSLHETAYPRLKSSVTAHDLATVYTPTEDEIALAYRVARGAGAKLCFLVLLKTFQRLGYFVPLREVPAAIVQHIAGCVGAKALPTELARYDDSGTRRRHVPIIRQFINIRPFDDDAHRVFSASVREAAHTKEDLADLINIGIEELIRQRFELPGFSTLLEVAQRERAAVNRGYYQGVAHALDTEARARIDRLFLTEAHTRRSAWDRLKGDPGRPTLTNLKELVVQRQWLTSLGIGTQALAALPPAKARHFAVEAKSLDAARLQEMEPNKRYTLAVALIRAQGARALDDLGEMFVKRLQKIHHLGEAALEDYRRRHQARTDALIATLHGLLMALQQEGGAEERIAAMRTLLGDELDILLADCEAHAAYADNNYLPFLWRYYKSHRRTLFALLDEVSLASTSQDTTLVEALAFLRTQRHARGLWLRLPKTAALDLAWVPDKWWPLITGKSPRHTPLARVNRRHFEVCVFSQVMWELKSGDLCIEGAEQFSDYRAQLISWQEYEQTVAEYGAQVGLPVAGHAFVEHARAWLEAAAEAADAAFPTNAALRLENGEPVLSRLERSPVPGELKLLEPLISERMEPINILDALADTEIWLHWTRFFGPLSGHDAKIEEARARYVTTTFCYGCGLGPTQTARSLKSLDRRQVAWINQRHVTEAKLQEAITALINAYNRFTLPKLWGSGKHASADGTKWDVYEQNLLSEYHIRYGGYGGIGYYHVSDTYVALFSHFIPCGVWDAVYILDGLLNNTSDIQPDTLHADTQGQSAPVFGLAYLLGIELMPRIRNWKDLKLFRPRRGARYAHIDELFSETIDWELIQRHLPDMLRVVLSIRAGRISASTLLRKLGTYSRKNKLYFAFRELGRVVRTGFLLRYLTDPELRRTIQAATNKSEAFNNFVKWVAFARDATIAENDRDEQRKLIKYNHLVANCLIFHNVHALTRLLHQLAHEGHDIPDEALAHLSPYLTEHINRFGDYRLDLGRSTHLPDYTLNVRPFQLTP